MEQNGNTTSYFDQQQDPLPATYVAYPSTSSYPYQQQSYTQPQQSYAQQQQSYSAYGNSYGQAINDYATNQYYQQQQQQYQQSPLSTKSQSNLKWNTKRKSPYGKPPSSGITQQLYCEICKVSCVGEQSYKVHCEGQKHKKKELILSNGATPTKAKPGATFFCDLCQVPCSGVDSFNAHLNGKSHIKVCNLQVKMGKQVPTDLVAPILKPVTGKPVNENAAGTTHIKVIGTPAINFVRGECLNTMVECESVKMETTTDQANGEQQQTNGTKSADPNNSTTEISAAAAVDEPVMEQNDQQNGQKNEEANGNSIPFIDDQDNAANQAANEENAENQAAAEPVGLEFVFEFSQPNSKATFFSCTLCNCKFSEFTAKEQHIRGKRHLKAFKMKNKNGRSAGNNQAPMTGLMPASNLPIASPSLPLTKKAPFGSPALTTPPKMRRPPSFANLLPSNAKSNKKLRTNDGSALNTGDPAAPEQPADDQAYQENIDILSFIGCDFYETPHTSHDNRYLLRKHTEIVPREDDLKAFYKHISNVERSLKLVSDDFLQNVDELRETLGLPVAKDGRILQGEIRAGLFGKKLLLRDERQIDLILFCSVKPNIPLLKRVAELLSGKLAAIEDEKYEVRENVEMAGIDVLASNATIRITLTSLYFRDMNVPAAQNGDERYKDPDQMLDRQRCLDALTALRRFKWYLAKIAPFQPCPMLIRLLKDLTKRVPAWKPLTCWALELICERILSNFISQPSPADGFKFILRTVASGALLSDSYDALLIQDPCEYEKTDALSYLTEQQRQDLTNSAQDFVGLISFNKIHQVLAMERIDFSLPTKRVAGEVNGADAGEKQSNGDEKSASGGEMESGEQKSNFDIGISGDQPDITPSAAEATGVADQSDNSINQSTR